MTQQQLLEEINRLSLEERAELLAALARSMQEELRARGGGREGSSVARLRGLLKPEGKLPSDAELADDYASHLLEKYA